MQFHGVKFAQDEVAAFCKKHGIARLALFGSILRADFAPESDVDVLVEFLPGRTPSLYAFAGMQMELSSMVGRRVDLRTPEDLSQYFRNRVMRQAVIQYAA